MVIIVMFWKTVGWIIVFIYINGKALKTLSLQGKICENNNASVFPFNIIKGLFNARSSMKQKTEHEKFIKKKKIYFCQYLRK